MYDRYGLNLEELNSDDVHREESEILLTPNISGYPDSSAQWSVKFPPGLYFYKILVIYERVYVLTETLVGPIKK